MESIRYLDELSIIASKSLFVTCHGMGQGGGEKIATQIRERYPETVFLSHRSYGLIFKSLARALVDGCSNSILLTAGIRDLPVIILCIIIGWNFSLYIQVPYYRAVKRIGYYSFYVWLYYTLVRFWAHTVFVNSESCIPVWPHSRKMVILPIWRQSLRNKAYACSNAIDRFPGSNHNSSNIVDINFVCRLQKEHGNGSRDIDAMLQLVREVRQMNIRSTNYLFRVNHWGEICPAYHDLFTRHSFNSIVFHGYNENWLNKMSGILVCLSKYEGFGLAAYEACSAGYSVVVNQAFPKELLLLCPDIIQVKTNSQCRPILPQFLPHLLETL